MTGGVIAAARRTAPPVVVPFEKLGEQVSGSATNSATLTVAMPTITGGILANDLIVVWTSFSRGASGITDLTAAGYTQLYDEQVTSASITSGIACFAKLAAGGETTMSISTTGTGTHTSMARVYRGALMPDPVDPFTVGTGSGTYSANSVVVDKAGSLVVSHLGGRGGAAGNVAPAWSNGAVVAYSTASGRVAYLSMAEQQVDSGTVTHMVTTTNVQGGPSTGVGSIVIKPAA